MPTYGYTCPQDHEFELFERKISSKSRAKCPKCGKMATRQVSGGSGFHLKGSGFYGTDYKATAKGDAGEKAPKSDDAANAAKPDTASTDKNKKKDPPAPDSSGATKKDAE